MGKERVDYKKIVKQIGQAAMVAAKAPNKSEAKLRELLPRPTDANTAALGSANLEIKPGSQEEQPFS